MYIIRGTVSAQVANETSGGTEELKKRYRIVDAVLRKDTTYYFCDTVRQAEFTDIK